MVTLLCSVCGKQVQVPIGLHAMLTHRHKNPSVICCVRPPLLASKAEFDEYEKIGKWNSISSSTDATNIRKKKIRKIRAKQNPNYNADAMRQRKREEYKRRVARIRLEKSSNGNNRKDN